MCSPRTGLLILLLLIINQGCVSPYRSSYNYPYGQGMYGAPGYAPVMSNQPGVAPVISNPPQPGTFVPSTPTPLPSTGNNAPPYNPGTNTNPSPGLENPFPTGNGTSTYPVPYYPDQPAGSPTSMNAPVEQLPAIVPEELTTIMPASSSSAAPSSTNTSTKASFDQLPIADSPPLAEPTETIKPVSQTEDATKFERPFTVDQQPASFDSQPAPAPVMQQPKPVEQLPEIVPFSMEGSQPQSQIIKKVNHEFVTTTSTTSNNLMKLAYDGESMRWVQGILKYDDTKNNWEVQYSKAPDPNDPHKGRINLVNDPRLNRMKPQDLVQIEGQVTRMNNGEEFYRITSITKLDPSFQ